MATKKYKGSCYIGVVGSETENGQCRDSIEAITKRDGDIGPVFIRATKGYEARQTHLNNWYYRSKKPFILFLDHDMIFPNDTLERMRGHGLPYVSGWYPRRMIPTLPIWFDNNEPGTMPMRPMTAIPQDKALYQIGASGWGCILMHRDVVTAVKKVLKGEPEIIEDDMDIYPYDLNKTSGAIKGLREEYNRKAPITSNVLAHIETLEREIIPLRGVKDTVGSDIRFPFYAKLAGFQLWGDSGVKCSHVANYPIRFDDYAMQSGIHIRNASLQIHEDNLKEVERLRKAVEG